MQNFIPTLDLPRNLLCPRTLSLAVTSCLIPELRRPLTSPDLDEASLLPSPPRWAPLSHVIHHQWTGLPHSPLLLEATGPHCWSPPPSPSTGHRRIEPTLSSIVSTPPPMSYRRRELTQHHPRDSLLLTVTVPMLRPQPGSCGSVSAVGHAPLRGLGPKISQTLLLHYSFPK
jgi:hypothetical protein